MVPLFLDSAAGLPSARLKRPPGARRGVRVLLAVLLVAAAFSGYLLWAQLGPIGAICQWCLGNDLTISVVAVLYVVRMLTEKPA